MLIEYSNKKYKSVSLLARIFVLLFALLLVLAFSPSVRAADFRTAYDIEYFIKDNDPQNNTKTSYVITLTNLRPDIVIKKFTLVFPKSFGLSSVVAKDFGGSIAPEIVEKERTVEISFQLNNPKAGLNEVNILYLDFLQKNIFRSKGTIWEIFIPTLENLEGDTHTITLNLPVGRNKKLSLAKPVPDLVTFDKVVWNNYRGKSIYAAFGDEQRYSLDLTYNLNNPNVSKVYTDVAFPPDTLYQKIIIDSIVPLPDSVYSDPDGNFMARYFLGANEKKTVQFKGIAKIFTLPRTDYKAFIKKQFSEQQRSLFNAQPLWKLAGETPITSSNIKDHYAYTTKTLAYNFSRVITGNSRMGASQALAYPDQAVCTEYSDLLIASARQRGIYAREVQGFAFANEQELRPISTESDILHSWVEYYDEAKEIWVPIDPTWEDTSGIDYFNSFDFNHIVFALHGKKADYPYPAGSYKAAPGGHDIHIEPTTLNPLENKSITGSLSQIPLPFSGDSYAIDLFVKNSGNVNMWSFPIEIGADNAVIETPSIVISHLLPGEIKKISVIFKPKQSLLYQDVRFTVKNSKSILVEQTIKVPTFLTSFKGYLIPAGCIIGGILVLILLFKKRDEEE